MAFTWLIFAVLVCLCPITTGAVEARLCVTSDSAMTKCTDMAAAFAKEGMTSLICMQAPSQYTCMRMVKYSSADIMKVDDTDLYAAAKFYDLLPILMESSSTVASEGLYLYKAVVIIRANSTINSLSALSQKKSCHTGVGKTVGWTVPVSKLQAQGVMTVKDCDNTVDNVADFFVESCAPGAYNEENNIDGDNPDNVCSLCENKRCPSTDKYAGYSGAVQCLLDGRGDVAFAKHTTINSLASQTSATIRKEDFKLLCPDGNRKPVDEWNTCSWATRPNDVILTAPFQPTKKVEDIINLLQEGARIFNSFNDDFNMFNSTKYQGDDVIFTDGMKQLKGLSDRNYSSYLGPGFLNTMESYQTCTSTDRWCVVSLAEENKCVEMRAAFAAARFTSKMTCVRATSHKDCMEKIENGGADLLTLGEEDLFIAGKHYSLVPIMAENYEETNTTNYWAVAVVKKTNTVVNINNLKGKTSCHPGIMDTSGWSIPIGTLVEKGSITVEDKICGLGKAVGNFFSQSCVPGALNTKYNPAMSNPANLCELCGGKQFCQMSGRKNSTTKYSGQKGAFRCLVEKNADVAFVKHTTVPDNTDGKLKEDWAVQLKSSDFELLCPDGSRKPVDQWPNCNLARVPSHAVVTSSKKSQADRRHYATILKKGDLKFGVNSTGFKMFSSYAEEHSMFDDTTIALSKIDDNEQDYRKWLGNQYAGIIEALGTDPCTSGKTALVFCNYYLFMLLISFIIFFN